MSNGWHICNGCHNEIRIESIFDVRICSTYQMLSQKNAINENSKRRYKYKSALMMLFLDAAFFAEA